MLGRMKNANDRALPTDPRLRFWLQAEGSLTARLRVHGPVHVLVQRQGRMPLWADEQTDLKVPGGYVREVVLLLNNRPAVWARSATPLPAIKGPWRALQGLGSRPLAELLFAGRAIDREALRPQHLPRSGSIAHHIRQQWLAVAQKTPEAGLPHWARSSVFLRHGAPLRVMEAFSPWVCTLA
jgi:chorismate--pyruvate lyase